MYHRYRRHRECPPIARPRIGNAGRGERRGVCDWATTLLIREMADGQGWQHVRKSSADDKVVFGWPTRSKWWSVAWTPAGPSALPPWVANQPIRSAGKGHSRLLAAY